MKTYIVASKKDGEEEQQCCFKKFNEALRAAVEIAKLDFSEDGVNDVICTCMALEEQDDGDVNVSFEEEGMKIEIKTEEA